MIDYGHCPLYSLFRYYAVNRDSHAEAECVCEDRFLCEAHVFAPTIMELFKCFFLLVRELFLQFLVMPCHITEQFFHLRGVGSAVLLRYDVAMPQIFYNAFHRLHLLLAQHNTTEENISPAVSENKIYLFSAFWHSAHM